MSEIKNTRDGQGREDARAKFIGSGVPNIPEGIPHMGFNCIHPRVYPEGRSGRDNQMGTNVNNWSLPWTLLIPHRFGGFNIKQHKWAHLLPVQCVILR